MGVGGGGPRALYYKCKSAGRRRSPFAGANDRAGLTSQAANVEQTVPNDRERTKERRGGAASVTAPRSPFTRGGPARAKCVSHCKSELTSEPRLQTPAAISCSAASVLGSKINTRGNSAGSSFNANKSATLVVVIQTVKAGGVGRGGVEEGGQRGGGVWNHRRL